MIKLIAILICVALVGCSASPKPVTAPGTASLARRPGFSSEQPQLIGHPRCTNCPPEPPVTNIVVSWTPGTNDYSYQIWVSTNLQSPYWHFVAWVTNQTSYTNKNQYQQEYFLLRPFSAQGYAGPFT